MNKLWQKNYTQNSIAEAYCFGDGAVLDNQLVLYDVLGSMAHAHMLSTIGILTKGEDSALQAQLSKILALASKKEFVVTAGDEDVHTKVENFLAAALGPIGKKIHTGRSRNDQVLVDLRLYAKDQCLQLSLHCLDLAKQFAAFAGKHEFIPMPGYTHMQKAMPSSVGMWAASFAESLLGDADLIKSAYQYNDQNPLGSGAAYGVSLPINREMTSELLGFAKTQNNALYCQSSRLKSQLVLMAAMTQLMLTLSRFAGDVLLFTTSEFNFFSVNPEICTGSSIMPQKKNVDVLEYLRARAHTVAGYEAIVAAIAAGLPSGYNADFGETKWPFMKSIETTEKSMQVINLVLAAIQPNEKTLKDVCTPELYATHAAFDLVQKGMPFRDAYQAVGKAMEKLPVLNPFDILYQSNHIGGTGNLGLKTIPIAIQKKYAWWVSQRTAFIHHLRVLKGGEIYE